MVGDSEFSATAELEVMLFLMFATCPINVMSESSLPGPIEERDSRDEEVFWMSHYDFLAGAGYVLPGRYRSDWVPMRLQEKYKAAAATTHRFWHFKDETTPFVSLFL